MAIEIVVTGASGRMGQAIATLAAGDSEVELVGGVVREEEAGSVVPGYGRVVGPAEAGPMIARADLVIDFSAPQLLARLLERDAEALAGRPLVVGTTGLTGEIMDRLRSLSERSAVMVAANFSLGVNLLIQAVEDAARKLPADRFDVEIVEAHHHHKVDAPSGTALALGEAVAAGRGQDLADHRRDGRSGETGARPRAEIGFHALRGGTVPGEHRVYFMGGRERLEFAHVASDRLLFAEGALAAAHWLAGREPGWYTMRDLLAG